MKNDIMYIYKKKYVCSLKGVNTAYHNIRLSLVEFVERASTTYAYKNDTLATRV